MDSIANFLTIIRNGVLTSKAHVSAPYARMNHAIASILKDEGFIREVEVSGEGVEKRIKVQLKYVDGESVIHEITRVSTPGRRMYANIHSVRPVIGGLGLTILSTSRGVVTHKKAKALSVGGEVICTVW
jgi:small subunit ribosomal protein S8